MKIEFEGQTYPSVESFSQAALCDEIAEAALTPTPEPKIKPTAGQLAALEAVADVMSRPGPSVMAIIGYAGVGKTTMLRLISDLHGKPLVITPTGKAALRVMEATGVSASTIHRWLYLPVEDLKTGRTRFERRTDDAILIPSNKLVLIDEASMVGRDIWKDVSGVADRFGLRVVCVGDGFQLPPVQDKNTAPFSLLDPAVVPNRSELTEVLRQAQDSAVVRASMRLREGMDVRALAELPKVNREDLLKVALATREQGGVVICATNATRFKVNAGMRGHLSTPYPQPGEPLLILRNNYEFDAYNGEQMTFEGWRTPPNEPTRVRDRYTEGEADLMFGEAIVEGRPAIICVDELHGAVSNNVGGLAVAIGAEHWARANHCHTFGKITPYLQANFGYAYTAHKSQGSEWPYALVILEPNIKLDTEDGRRWAYTAVTRAKNHAAIFYGRV